MENKGFTKASEYESSNLFKLQMLRNKNNKTRNFYKNCSNTANVQLHLIQLQVRCLLLNVKKNIGIVTSSLELDMKSAFSKFDNAEFNENNYI